MSIIRARRIVLTCHTPVAGYVLGVNTRQLNGSLTYPATGNTDNQLRTLNRLGLFYPAINEAAIPGYLQLFSLTNTSASLQDRARSYLEANCVQCHQPGGTGPTFDARFDTPLANQDITNYPAKFPLGVDNACIVKSQDIWRSVLLSRINSTNSTIKMPPLARNLIDTTAVQVMTDWINSLPGTPALAPPVITPNGGSFVALASVALSAPNTNATIYYTLDGSLPTTNSFEYYGAFNLFTNATVSASAFASNFDNSITATASFLVQPLYFISATYLTNQTLQLDFMGAPGSNYVLQATTNFTTWVRASAPILRADQSNLFCEFEGLKFPRSFYRVLQQ